MKKISLFYREGASDKVYHAGLEPKGNGLWVVNFAYGRRGSTLTNGTKTSSPVPLDAAEKIYDKLVAGKIAKGYTPYEGGTPYSATDKAGQVSGILPQLLNPVEDDVWLERLLNDSEHCAQEKHDGRRMLIRKKGNEVVGINRRGLVVALPEPVERAAQALKFSSATGETCDSFILDGEAVGDVFFAFDLLEAEHDLRRASYEMRYLALTNLLAKTSPSDGAIQLVHTAWKPAEKRTLFEQLKERKAEGAVFKDISSPCTIGRPGSGGPQLKYKFYATCSAVVLAWNEQRSVLFGLWADSECQPWGNVTIPPNRDLPGIGVVIELRYLYAYRNGSLYQPTYLGERIDIESADCTTDQLKFKATNDEDDQAG